MERTPFYASPVFWIIVPITMLLPYFIGRLQDKMMLKAREALEEENTVQFINLIGEVAGCYRNLESFRWFSLKKINNPYARKPYSDGFDDIDYQACYEHWHKNVFLPFKQSYRFNSFIRGNSTSPIAFIIYFIAAAAAPVIVLFILNENFSWLSIVVVLSGVISAFYSASGTITRNRRFKGFMETLISLDGKLAIIVREGQPEGKK